MTVVALTGGNGFLGWHTRCAAHAYGIETRVFGVGDRFDARLAQDALTGSDRFVHIAGVNRGTDNDVHDGNILFAEQTADAIKRSAAPPPTVVFANSIQSGGQSAYGQGKREAAEILKSATESVGSEFIDALLPNVFGEHGRPFYNSVVATFCHQLSAGGSPHVEEDRDLILMHAQDASDILLGRSSAPHLVERREHVGGLLRRLTVIAEIYAEGQIPDLDDAFDRDLFNTYRSFAFETRPMFELKRHTDRRGSFFEIIRSHGGTTQSSFSTTTPGVTRGQHYHRRKVERFTVISGEAAISLRRLFHSDQVDLRLSGTHPVAVDMPTMWAHKITNVGRSELYTSFWANELFDTEYPDTVAEDV